MAIGIACALVGLVSGCGESNDGAAARSKDSTTTPSTSASTTSTTATASMSTIGVVETSRKPLEPKAKTCDPLPLGPAAGTQHVSFVQGGSPGTPIVDIVARDTWKFAVAQGNPVMAGTGPDGLTGSLTVTPTDLGPAEAFDKYADDIAKKAPISAINLRPAELCGYSGQELFGTLSGGAEPPVEFSDRIAHIWTNTATYLAAIHVQGPKDAPGFDVAKDTMMSDFAVVIP